MRRVDLFPSTHHPVDLLRATFAHATYHPSTNLRVLAKRQADNHVLGNPESLHGYYGTRYDPFHDDPITLEWLDNAVQVDHQYDDPINLQAQLNALLLMLHLTSVLQQLSQFADIALLHPKSDPDD